MKTCLAVFLMLAAPTVQERGLRIFWIDVEGGAATLIVTPEGGSLLMDCGFPGARDAERIHKAATQAAGLKKIDHYVTSHFHADHWGGLAKLAELMPIEKFYDHGFPEGEAKDIDPRLKEAYLKATQGKAAVLKPGDVVPLRGAEVRILCAHGIVTGEKPGDPQTRPCDKAEHAARPDDPSENARSLGFLLTFGSFKFVDLGDLTWNVEHKLVCPANLIGAVDVYQVTHHGQDNSNHPALLKAVAPTVAVINNGPKKGGSAVTFKRLKETPGLRDVFQVHRNAATAAEDNAPPEFTANDEAACRAEGVVLTVEPSGKAYTVEIPSKKTIRNYRTK
jgi:beta-lactamase superfamily II metal-dependent hydrolase